MQRRANYSMDELAACALADLFSDLLIDGQPPSLEQTEQAKTLLGRLACEGERSRYHLRLALTGLGERNAKKRATLRATLED